MVGCSVSRGSPGRCWNGRGRSRSPVPLPTSLSRSRGRGGVRLLSCNELRRFLPPVATFISPGCHVHASGSHPPPPRGRSATRRGRPGWTPCGSGSRNREVLPNARQRSAALPSVAGLPTLPRTPAGRGPPPSVRDTWRRRRSRLGSAGCRGAERESGRAATRRIAPPDTPGSGGRKPAATGRFRGTFGKATGSRIACNARTRVREG